MNYLIIDVESTVVNWGTGKGGGNPFNQKTRLVCVGLKTATWQNCFKIEYDGEPFGEQLEAIQARVDSADILVAFNAKYDLHWLRRYGIKFQHKRIWDVQLAHFILTAQESSYPSLNEVGAYYNVGQKTDVVETEYWFKKIETDQVPWDILSSYNLQDCGLTESCYLKQLQDLKDKPALHRLINLALIDLLILEEMEWNGLLYDVEKSLAKAKDILLEIDILDNKLRSLVADPRVNWNSGDQLSAILYGGTITFTNKVPDGIFKSGKKVGQTKYRNQDEVVKFERLVNPIKGSELKKDGYWSTDESNLRSLNAKGKAKKIIDLVLKRGELEKAVSSYYAGIPNLLVHMGWANDTVHATLNQCVAVTGRLSSSKPNIQNTPEDVDELFRSRFC